MYIFGTGILRMVTLPEQNCSECVEHGIEVLAHMFSLVREKSQNQTGQVLWFFDSLVC